jgi:hypothetical protein
LITKSNGWYCLCYYNRVPMKDASWSNIVVA